MIDHFIMTQTRFLLLLIVLFSISCKQKCRFRSIDTILYMPSIGKDSIIEYIHYISVKDFSRHCIDSAEMVNIMFKYIDTVSVGKPICAVRFYDLRRDIHLGMTNEEPTEMSDHCFLAITVNLPAKKPTFFIFYGETDDEYFNGECWLKKEED